jgi:hypothetical protein
MNGVSLTALASLANRSERGVVMASCPQRHIQDVAAYRPLGCIIGFLF